VLGEEYGHYWGMMTITTTLLLLLIEPTWVFGR